MVWRPGWLYFAESTAPNFSTFSFITDRFFTTWSFARIMVFDGPPFSVIDGGFADCYDSRAAACDVFIVSYHFLRRESVLSTIEWQVGEYSILFLTVMLPIFKGDNT
jgi:hypothetical protein